jgi:hypothetical protein
MEPHVHRAVPDWGETQSWGLSSSSTKLDDEAIARQLQQQYDREVNGQPGGVSSLEEDSVTVARRLQARCTVLLLCIGAAAWCTRTHITRTHITRAHCLSSDVQARHCCKPHVSCNLAGHVFLQAENAPSSMAKHACNCRHDIAAFVLCRYMADNLKVKVDQYLAGCPADL